MRKRILGLVLVLLLPTVAWGQNCTRGKRCGNTCIAANETCHVGRNDAEINMPALLGITAGVALLAVIIYGVNSTSTGYSLNFDENGGTAGYRWSF